MNAGSLLPILAALSLAIVFAWQARRTFFGRSRGQAVSADQVKVAVAELSAEERDFIDAEFCRQSQQMQRTLCVELVVATALTAEQPVVSLRKTFVFREYMDSLVYTEFIMLVEKLATITIDDDDIGRLLTFERLLIYVTSRVAAGP